MTSQRLSSFALCLLTLAGGASLQAGIGFSITIGPPPIPVYEQPAMVVEGDMWTPGYWAYGDGGYFWVPGSWVTSPGEGLLWTPGYWSWDNRFAVFHAGYWGHTVGFYGGINYGYGYGGDGFQGGHWQGHDYYYNRAVTNLGGRQTGHVYEQAAPRHNDSRVAFNGGNGGVQARPSGQELAAAREHHVPATAQQRQNHQQAGRDRQQLASVNHGSPAVTARKPSESTSQQAKPGRGPGSANVASAAQAARSGAAPARANTPAARPAANQTRVQQPPASPRNGRSQVQPASERTAAPRNARPQEQPAAPRNPRPQQPPARIPGLERRPQPEPGQGREPRPEPRPPQVQPHQQPPPRQPQVQQRPQQAPRQPQQPAPRPQEQRQQAPARPNPAPAHEREEHPRG